MRAAVIELTLKDLQQAVLDYCSKLTPQAPDTVLITSYDKHVITIETYKGGGVSAIAFYHKHNA